MVEGNKRIGFNERKRTKEAKLTAIEIGAGDEKKSKEERKSVSSDLNASGCKEM